ncbi:MAG: cytochrome c, partial [Saprospiraceae bacterium]|nr:cytochrome c [Saprospiraceae bacterium]
MKPSSLFLATGLLLASQWAWAQDITWADDAACIIFNSCVKCHNPDGVAPFSLMTYEQAYDKRALIGAYVEAGIMPPWPASGGAQAFVNDNRLTETEIATIVAWV